MHLGNFEFVKNSDSYINDKVYDKLKLEVEKFFKSEKCTYSSNCFEKISYEQFLACRIDFKSLNKNMKDMVIKEQLLAFQQDENTKKVIANNRKVLHFKYHFNNSIPVCHTIYQNLIGIRHTYLNNVIKCFQECGLEKRIHSNTGKTFKNMNHVEINYNIACKIYNFLKNYADIYELPSSRRNFSKISMPVIFLPTSFSYTSVYCEYIQACKDEYGEKTHILSESTFHNIWRVLILSLQFMSPKFDLYETCKTMKSDIQYAIEHKKKLAITENYLAHLNHAK